MLIITVDGVCRGALAINSHNLFTVKFNYLYLSVTT